MSLQLPKSNSNYWSFADQVLVSGGNFLCGILLARVLGVENLGRYVIATAYLFYANGFQTSLVMAPMMTAVPLLAHKVEQDRLIRGFFAYALMVMVFSTLLVLLGATMLGHFIAPLGVGSLALALLAAMASFQIQDWLRRALFARSFNLPAFIADAVAYGGQFLGLAALSLAGMLTPETALWVLSLAFAVSSCGTLAALRLTPDFRGGTDVIRRYWRTSRDLLVSLQFQWVSSSGIILMGSGMIGPQAAGAIRAAQNLLGPVNVMFQWMDNVIPVVAARRLQARGSQGLWHYLSLIGAVGVCLIAIFTVVLWAADETLMVWLYGESYRPFAFLIVLQALFFLFGHIYRMFAYGSRALDRTNRLVTASMWWAVAASACALLSVGLWQERGILIAVVVGEAVAVAFLAWSSWRDRRLRGVSPCVHVVLRRGDGSVHLLLPAAAGAVLHGALSLYSPSRWTGHVYKQLLRRLIPWQSRLHWGEPTTDLAGWRSHMETIIPTVPGAAIERVAGLVSGFGLRAKIVVRLMDPEGHALAYVRLAQQAEAAQALEREREMLTFLAHSKVFAQVPTVLRWGRLEGPAEETGYFLAQSAGGDTASSRNLTVAHFGFLEKLLTGAMVSWKDHVASLQETCRAGPFADDELVARSLTWLASAPFGRLPDCIQHGDFAPWNIRTQPDGSLFVFDWEHGEQTGFPAIDALHFGFQQAVLVTRSAPADAVLFAICGLTTPAGERYLSSVNLNEDDVRWLMGLYLLSALVRRGQGMTDNQRLTRAYPAALSYLLVATH